MRKVNIKASQVKHDTIKENKVIINNYSRVYYHWDIDENIEKDWMKAIRNIETIVRGCPEYREYINFLKSEIDMNRCSFLPNIDRNEIGGIGIEIHHAPLTLFDITSIVTRIQKYDLSEYDPFSIAEEVMKLHFEGKVGLIPVSTTVHELIHNGDIFVPINKVYGNVKQFVREYKRGFTDDQLKLLKDNIELSKQLDNNYRPDILERRFTYLEVEGMKFPKLLNLTTEAS